MGYPDEEGEIELLRRRRGRTVVEPAIEQVSPPVEVDVLGTVFVPTVRELPRTLSLDARRYQIGLVARDDRLRLELDESVLRGVESEEHLRPLLSGGTQVLRK